MKPAILALIMLGILAAVILVIVLAVKPASSSSPASPSRTLGGSLVQPVPRRSASGYT